MRDSSGQKLKSNQEKVDAFAKTFIIKTKEAMEKVKIEENVYNRKKKIFSIHEETWLTRELVEKSLQELKSKKCFGFDRILLVFLKDEASSSSTL